VEHQVLGLESAREKYQIEYPTNSIVACALIGIENENCGDSHVVADGAAVGKGLPAFSFHGIPPAVTHKAAASGITLFSGEALLWLVVRIAEKDAALAAAEKTIAEERDAHAAPEERIKEPEKQIAPNWSVEQCTTRGAH